MLSSVPGGGLLGSHLSWGGKVVEVCPRTICCRLSQGPNTMTSSIGGVSLFNGIAQRGPADPGPQNLKASHTLICHCL